MDPILGHFARPGVPLHLFDTSEAAIDAARRLAARGPIVYEHEDVTMVLRGRPRLPGQTFDEGAIAPALLSLYRRRGSAFLTEIRGPFALVIVELETERALLAVDRMGMETLCWSHDEKGLVFGSSASWVARTSAPCVELNRQAFFDFMYNHMVAAPDTVYAGVQRLPLGTALRYDSGKPRLERYWHPDFARVSKQEIASLEEAVLPILGRAVEAAQPDEQTGCFLSGGLDSSTVAGVFAGLASTPAKAFSVGFGVDQYDELTYARIASGHFGCLHHEYVVTPNDIVEMIPRIAAAYDEPFGNSSAVPTFCCARFASEHGIDHLLAGDGGDELFGGNERYVRQRVFEMYRRLPSGVKSLLAEPFANRVDPESAPWPLRKLSSYIRQARVPLPERFQSWNMIYREDPATVFHPELLASVDTDYPMRRMREVWESCPSDDLLDRMLWFDWKFTLADNDLRKVTQMTNVAGVRVSFPMLDEELIDFSLKIPSDEKIAGSELRAFYKRALRNFLPKETIEKEKHGFGLPFGLWLKTDEALQELVYGSLETLKSRDLLAPRFIDLVAAEHKEGHASYYGYAIWDLVMLEQWLREAQAFARVPGK